MKKLLLIVLSILIALSLVFVAWTIWTIVSSGLENNDDQGYSLRWLKEESYFVDYEITSANTIKFRYSICLVNDTEDDITVSLSAKFEKNELKGWVEQDDFFLGCDENGNWLYQEIKGGEKKNVIFVFEGKYLGGDPNENLSFPSELMVMTDFKQ